MNQTAPFAGLPGAPVRTPVRTSGAATGPGLWPAIVGRMLTRQMWIELYGLPGYSQTLALPKAQGFAATPRDFRPHDPALAEVYAELSRATLRNWEKTVVGEVRAVLA